MGDALLFSPDEMGDNSLQRQMSRLHPETGVLIDLLTERGAKLEFISDFEAERARVLAASKTLWTWDAAKDWASRQWGRLFRPDDRFDVRRINRELVFVAHERKREEQLFSNKPTTNVNRRLMTVEEIDLAIDLHRCRYAPATFEKKFSSDMAHRAVHEVHPCITEKQAAVLRKMEHRYRRQLAALRTPRRA